MKFLILVIAHFLGDFIFQSSTMAKNKRINFKSFWLHCMIYAGLMISSLMWFAPLKNIILAAFIIIISHALIDYTRNILLNRIVNNSENYKILEFVIFIIDQILHTLILICMLPLLKQPNILAQLILNKIFLHITPHQLYSTTVLILLYILCLSPSAVLIKKVFVLFSFQDPEENDIKDDLIKSGYLIGILERIIILTLGLNGQLETIGFVLAAKSLARFNQLNNRNFAEKYLIGTLLSIAIALFCVTLASRIASA